MRPSQLTMGPRAAPNPAPRSSAHLAVTVTLLALTACTGKLGGGGGTGGQATSSSAGGGPHGGHGGAVSASSSSSAASTASSGSADPCAGVTCSGHGTCSSPMGQPVCACQPGYHPVGADCAADETCAGKACGDCGTCEVQNGLATCVCPMNYAWNGADCKLAIDPCASANCAADEYCVPEAHCLALGVCVATCDCSNCPNCSPDNSDGKWNDLQEYCGAGVNQSPATMACNKPCPSGTGCLPYATQICWPLEGCFSL